MSASVTRQVAQLCWALEERLDAAEQEVSDLTTEVGELTREMNARGQAVTELSLELERARAEAARWERFASDRSADLQSCRLLVDRARSTVSSGWSEPRPAGVRELLEELEDEAALIRPGAATHEVQADGRLGDPLTCPNCGAVAWGNAMCSTCRSHWPGGDPVRVAD